MITLDNLRDALRALCYEPSGDGTVYQKSWEETSAQITVDFSKKRIGYPKDLGFKVNKDTTCNFSDNENFVVLACVTMLLDKGYRPESLELEREWALGHEQKSGRADICINDERATHSQSSNARPWNRVQKRIQEHAVRRRATPLLLATRARDSLVGTLCMRFHQQRNRARPGFN